MKVRILVFIIKNIIITIHTIWRWNTQHFITRTKSNGSKSYFNNEQYHQKRFWQKAKIGNNFFINKITYAAYICKTPLWNWFLYWQKMCFRSLLFVKIATMFINKLYARNNIFKQKKQPSRGALKQSNFTETTLQHGRSPVNLLHIFRIPFTKNTSGRLFLKQVISHYSQIILTGESFTRKK